MPGRTVRVIVAEFLLRFVALRRRAARRRRAVDVDGGVATTLRRSERSQRICHVRRRCRHRRQGWQLDARFTRGVPELRGDRDAVRLALGDRSGGADSFRGHELVSIGEDPGKGSLVVLGRFEDMCFPHLLVVRVRRKDLADGLYEPNQKVRRW